MYRKLELIYFQKLTRIFLFSLFFFFIFAFQQFLSWPILGSLHNTSHAPFIDLRSTLQGIECYRQIGLEVYSVGSSSPCFYIYGSTLLKILAPTSLTATFSSAIGWIFIGSASFVFGTIYWLIRTKSKKLNLVYMLILFSPVTFLLLERGNIDVIILCLLVLAALAYKSGYKFIAVILILFCSLLKFYTLPMALIFCFLMSNKKKQFVGLALALLTFFQIINDVDRLVDMPNVANSSFGNPVLAMYLTAVKVNLSLISQHLIGVFLLLITVTLLNRLQYSFKVFKVTSFPSIERWDLSNTLQAMFMVTYLSCYVAGVNFDHRLIFLSLACVLEIARSHEVSNLFPVILGLDLVVNWVTNTKYLEPFGDFSLLLITAYFMLLLRPFAKRFIQR